MLKLTVQELLASGCLSRCTFSDEVKDDGASASGNMNSLPRINAARISLMVVKASVRYLCSDSDGCNNGLESGDEVDYCSLNLSNFIVKLSSPNTDDGRLKDDVPVVVEEICEDLFDFEPLDYRTETCEDSFDFHPLDYRTETPVDGNRRSLEVLAHLFEEQSHVVGAPDKADAKGPFAGADNQNHERIVAGKPVQFISDRNRFDEMSSVSWILMGMEIQNDPLQREGQLKTISYMQKMQHMGRMLYEIFSLTLDSHGLQTLTSNRLSLDANIHDKELCSEQSHSKTPKLRRPEERSLFSDLLASGLFPTSVCRLLSDMIDVGEDGMADCPYISHIEVIDDLKQMICLPGLYLDDPENAFFVNGICFGLGCYGRTDQIKSILGLASSIEDKSTRESSACVEAIFVQGIAGSGKTFLIKSIADYLTTQGWVTFGGKFESSKESKDVVLIAFDKLIATLVSMKYGDNEHDVDYSREAIKAIAEALDEDSLASLANLIPSMNAVSHDLVAKKEFDAAEPKTGNSSYWRLIFLLSSLLGSILSADRHVLMYFDDLQWGTKKLAMIFELVISMGRLPHARSKLLFVGMFRNDNEIHSSHPVNSQIEVLQRHQNINVTRINLPNLSRDDVTEWLMSEMRLPKRFVVDISETIYKKAGQGHPLFTSQLLNSLVRDSIITYSPVKKRYSFDMMQLNQLQTWENVASLIVSNLSTLSDNDLQSLQVLACLGMQTERSILNHLKRCLGLKCPGIFYSLPRLIDAGIFEENTVSIMFAHDLIRDEIYHDIAVEQRKAMHLLIAECIGSHVPEFDTECDNEEKKLDESDVSSQSLICLATDQINNASDLVLDEIQRTRFAAWNLTAAAKATHNSNFQAATGYCKAGISFLGSSGWSQDTHQLSHNLHKGVALAFLAMGDTDNVHVYGQAIIKNVSFEQSLHARYLIIKALECSGKNQEAVDMAVVLVRQLGFQIPSLQRLQLGYFVRGLRGQFPEFLLSRIRETGRLASIHKLDAQINQHQNRVEVVQSKKDVLNILSAMIHAGFRVKSPYLPLIVCETVMYSLEHGCVCGEASLSFAYFGYLLLWTQGDYRECLRWGSMALQLIEEAKSRPFTDTRSFLYSAVLCWNKMPLRERARELLETYNIGMRYGDVAIASNTMSMYLRCLLFDGEKLSSLQSKYELEIESVAKFNLEVAKVMLLDLINIQILTQKHSAFKPFSIFRGMILDENSLLVDAQSQRNLYVVMAIYWRRFFEAFWEGSYIEAEKWAKLANNKAAPPMMLNLITSGARGIIYFQLYQDGKGNSYLSEGEKMLKDMEKWQEHCEHTVMNKVHLLRAERFASICEVRKAKSSYEAAIEKSRDLGRLNDGALAYERYGNYLRSIVEVDKSIECYKAAHSLYMQWGAVTLAIRVQEKYLTGHGIEQVSLKRSL